MIKQQRHDALGARSYEAAFVLRFGLSSWRVESTEPGPKSDAM